ncbi:MAG: acetyl-CoA C-acetyltransferase, partial [Candidatus Jidaibacter sp.]|nr:acetyl-CoA C-acetyltransferase [Candidatus Jidaibacter sp.]
MSTQDIAIVAAKRTAIGSFLGSLSNIPASKLGESVIKQVVTDTNIDPKEVSEVILGQILTANSGMNPARQASLGAGLTKETPAWMVNHVCGSGLKAVALGALSIQNGFGNIIIAGGQESMSLSPHAMMMRSGQKMGNTEFVDLMIKDGLTDVFNNYHMGITAENLAEKFNISRNEQDEFSTQSQNKAEKAQKEGKFSDEIVPVKVMVKKDEVEFKDDEFIRHGVQLEHLNKMRP